MENEKKHEKFPMDEKISHVSMRKKGGQIRTFWRKNLGAPCLALRPPRTLPSCPCAVCAIGDAMASVIGKVWTFFINFGTQKANDPAEKAIINDVKSHISELRSAHDTATQFDAGAARKTAINHVKDNKQGTEPTYKHSRVMCKFCFGFFKANR